MLLSGCKTKDNIITNGNHTCYFTDGSIKGTLLLCNNGVTIDIYDYNGDNPKISITLTDTEYCVSNGKYSMKNGFSENSELPPLILMCKSYLDYSLKNTVNANTKTDKNGYIEAINIDSIIYEFSKHKSTSTN